jgi:hypothetical protein
MDQDVLPPLLALRWALRFVANPPDGAFWPGLELRRGDALVGEIDVVVSDRRQLLFIEAKHNAASTDLRQLERIVEIARTASASFVVAAATGAFSDEIGTWAAENDVRLVDGGELSA